MTSRRDMIKEVKNIIIKQLGLDKTHHDLSPYTKLVDCGCDSLDAVEIIMAIEEVFDVSWEVEDFSEVTTVSDILNRLYNEMELLEASPKTFTKDEIQKFIKMKTGGYIPLDRFEWDETTKTFSTSMDGLIIDFIDIKYGTFIIGNRTAIETGCNCVINSGMECDITAGFGSKIIASSKSDIYAEMESTVSCDGKCKLTLGMGCITTTAKDCIFKFINFQNNIIINRSDDNAVIDMNVHKSQHLKIKYDNTICVKGIEDIEINGQKYEVPIEKCYKNK